MKLNKDQLNELILKSVNSSTKDIDINGELQTLETLSWKVRNIHLSWEKELITDSLNKIHQDSVEASLKAVVSLLDELNLIDVED